MDSLALPTTQIPLTKFYNDYKKSPTYLAKTPMYDATGTNPVGTVNINAGTDYGYGADVGGVKIPTANPNLGGTVSNIGGSTFKDIAGNTWDNEADMIKSNTNINENNSLAGNTGTNMLDGFSTKGFADIGGGLASLYSIYSGMQQNKRAQDLLDLQKAEYNRGVQKDRDFSAGMAKSGLGTYSAGVK